MTEALPLCVSELWGEAEAEDGGVSVAFAVGEALRLSEGVREAWGVVVAQGVGRAVALVGAVEVGVALAQPLAEVAPVELTVLVA